MLYKCVTLTTKQGDKKMKIAGTDQIIKALQKMQGVVQIKIDAVDWDKNPDAASEKDERLNLVWDAVDEAINAIAEIEKL